MAGVQCVCVSVSACACARVRVCVFDAMFPDFRQNNVSLFLLSSSFDSFVPVLCPSSCPPPPEQARRELRRLKEEARRKHAVAVIWAYWQGLKVPISPRAQPSPSRPPTHHPDPPHCPQVYFSSLFFCFVFSLFFCTILQKDSLILMLYNHA